MSFQQFNENYELQQVIGHGSCCTVRKVLRRDTRQVFAAKMYENQLLKAKNQIDMLIRLDHPSIVNIFQYYEQEGLIILILEYMSGGQLYHNVGQKLFLTEGQVREYMIILIDAIRYCHQMGVVHRDIKPQNLLLSTPNPDGVLKLADFGISKILSDEMLNTNCGTPIYMAPQIWNGEQYNEKVDIWSLGVVMYYLLSGQHPFNGDDEHSLGHNIKSNEVKFDMEVWGCISSRAIVLLKQLLNKDPRERPSAADILNHIWLNAAVVLSPVSTEEDQEIKLDRAAVKIGRYIYKSKLKTKKRSLMELMQAKKLPKSRLKFLTYKSLAYEDLSTTQEENMMAYE